MEPAWIVNVQEDPNFPRNKLAEDIGVKGGFGFPVIAAGQLEAVCEFFAEDEMEPDETLLRMVQSVGDRRHQGGENNTQRRHDLIHHGGTDIRVATVLEAVTLG